MSVCSALVICSSILRVDQYKLASQLTIIIILLFSGLIIGNTYCGGLSSIMTVPQYEKPIDTPAQLVARGMIWGASHDAWVYALEDSDEVYHDNHLLHTLFLNMFFSSSLSS